MNPYQEQIRYLYLGILNNYPELADEAEAQLTYDFAAKEWAGLRSRYALAEIAGNGTAFERARRLLHHFAPRLTHCSYYDNHVECNALQLLSYSYENPEHGINCLNKSKILAECCLALGICARRVFIQPFSPFDFDSHVVCEIFDEALGKWIMLDPTTDGYFVDGDRTPLSMLEIREHFLSSRFLTFVSSAGRGRDLQKTALRNENINLYVLKNCFLISFEQYNGFGKRPGSIYLVPKGYSVLRNQELNCRFRIEHIPKEHLDLLPAQEKYLQEIHQSKEPVAYTARSLYAPPLRREG